MNTFTPQHLLVQCIHISNKYILRIVKIQYTTDFITEATDVYPGVDCSNYIVFHNTAKWFERITTDIGYKNFKKVKLVNIHPGLWVIESNDLKEFTDVKNWFTMNIEQYIRTKLISYYEDEDSEKNIIDTIIEYAETNFHTMDDCLHHIDIQADFIHIKRPEILTPNVYILSIAELCSIIYITFYLEYNFDNLYNKYKILHVNIEDELDIPSIQPKLEFNTCEFTGNITVNKTHFHIKELVLYIIKTLDITSSEYLKIKSHATFKSIVETSTDIIPFSYADNDNYFWSGTPRFISYDPIIDLVTEEETIKNKNYKKEHEYSIMYFDIAELHTSITTQKVESLKIEKEINTATLSHQSPNLLYMNSISKEMKRCVKNIVYHNEMTFINALTMKTDIGKHIGDIIPHINHDNVVDIISDINSILKTLQTLYVPHVQIQSKTNEDSQLYYTRKYVEKYKNEDKETLASQVIDRIIYFISKHMDPKDINMNQIGRDLVELGVKKTRKTKGFVYGIEHPSFKDIDTKLGDNV